MANIKSQIKRNRQNERRRVRNIATRSKVKTHMKTALQAAEAGDDSVEEATRRAVQKIDKAAAKGVLHKNTAARKKSRLMKRIAAQG